MARGQDRFMSGQAPMKQEYVELAGQQPNIENVQDALQAAGIHGSVTRDEFGNIRIVTLTQPKERHHGSNVDIQYQHTFDSFVRSTPNPTNISIQQDTPYVSDFADDEESTLDLSSIRNSRGKTRMLRIPRQRGQSMLPRDATRYSTAPYPPSPSIKEMATSDNEEDENIPQKRQQKSFRIDEEPKVVAFIASRLKRMQQLADKKIAKAWIKGICPKKQAKFPYQNNRRETESGQKPVVPGWWPDPEKVCRFIEPDHIKRDERMRLCLHLLRLRPEPRQLQAWNGNTNRPHQTHVLHGWTAFLKELAGFEIFEELPKESAQRVNQRQELMHQMYEVAEFEQEYKEGSRDGSFVFSYTEDEEERKTLPIKRSRQTSIASSVGQESRQSSVSCERVKKAAKRDSMSGAATITTRTQCRKLGTEPMDIQISQTAPAQKKEMPSTAAFDFSGTDTGYESAAGSCSHAESEADRPCNSNRFVDQYEAVPVKRDSSIQGTHNDDAQLWHNYAQPASHWVDNTSSTSSFHQEQMGASDPYQMQYPSSTFPGRRDYEFPPNQHVQDSVQVRQMARIPQPEFHAVPTTPMFSPGSMVPMPLSNSAMHEQHCESGPSHGQAFTQAMLPSQYFMPAHAGSSVVDFHPPLAMNNMPYQDSHTMAERHVVPMQYHGLPSATTRSTGQPSVCWSQTHVSGNQSDP